MTVGELIDELGRFDEEMHVVTYDEEGCCDDEIKIAEARDEEPWKPFGRKPESVRRVVALKV